MSPKPKMLSELAQGARAVVDALHLPEAVAERLLGFGLVPGMEIVVAQSAPGGDPRVYNIDGCSVALRRETARLIAVREQASAPACA